MASIFCSTLSSKLYNGLKLLSWIGLIWDLKGVPDHIKFSKDKKHAQELKRAQTLRPPIPGAEGAKAEKEEEDVPVY